MIHFLMVHVAQSTVFALVAGLLTLAFRKNKAQVRYWLWLTASVKFLVPFAFLMSLGRALETWSPGAHQIAEQITTPAVAWTVEQLSEPLASAALPTASSPTIDWIPVAILGVWLCGFAAIALLRFRSWRRVRNAVRASTLIGISAPVDVRISPGLLEPGVVGVLRPVLLLPEGILNRLTASEMETVLAHELCHIRRRDNLSALLHMLVEAMFWFHPLVWWIGARLVDERERACDEEVLNQGNQPEVYADAILNVCKLYTESLLACVSGVTGASIKRRIEAIMSNRRMQGLNRAKKFLLGAAGVAALAGPVLMGLADSPLIRAQSAQALPVTTANQTGADQSTKTAQLAPVKSTTSQPGGALTAEKGLAFDAASIKLFDIPLGGGRGRQGPRGGGMSMTEGRVSSGGFGVSARRIIQTAYSLTDYQLFGGPGWLDADMFELEAKTEAAADKEQLRLMLRTLLVDRFKLVVHRGTKEMPVYFLTEGKSGIGPFLRERKDGESDPAPPHDLGSSGTGPTLIMRGSLQDIAFGLSGPPFNIGRPVLDKTGLRGNYIAYLHWDDADQEIIGAVQRELGLKFEPRKVPINILVIDHVEHPSEN